MKKLIVATFILLSVNYSVAEINASNQKAYTFSVIPQQAASKLARLWSPISNTSPIKLATPSNFALRAIFQPSKSAWQEVSTTSLI